MNSSQPLTCKVWMWASMLILLPAMHTQAHEPPGSSARFIANYYLDSRDFNTVSLIYSSQALPHGLTFWGFTDLHSSQNSDDNRSDFTTFFSEARLSKVLQGNWGLQGEYNDADGNDNDLVRFGVTYQAPLKKRFLMLRMFPLQTNGSHAQVSLAWRTPLGFDTLLFEGFIDYNILDGQSNRIVSEPQLRYMLGQRHGLTIEYRRNEFLRDSSSDEQGIALGFYYHF